MDLKKYNDSISQLNKAREVDRQSPTMRTDQKAYLYYLMALSHSNLHQREDAKKSIETSLKLNPRYQPAINFQARLNRR